MIEGVCDEKLCIEVSLRKKISLEDKIKRLSTLVPDPNIIIAVQDFKDAGNDAAHRQEAPDRELLRQSIHVTEELISYLYELGEKATRAGSVSKKAVLRTFKPDIVQ